MIPAYGIDKTGDCLRACIASLFDMPTESVPNVSTVGMEEWLRQQGYVSVWTYYAGVMDITDVYKTFGGNNPGVYYLVGGSIGGTDHIVVCCDDAIVCDPSMSRKGLDGPTSHGYYSIMILTPMRFVSG